VKVRLLYFAALREQLGISDEALELPAGIATVAGLRAYLMQRGEVWRHALGATRALRVAVNQDMAKPSTVLNANDEIAFFPPVTGG
jgi:sulfur-carrier protein